MSYREFLQTYFAQATIRCDKSIGSAHQENQSSWTKFIWKENHE